MPGPRTVSQGLYALVGMREPKSADPFRLASLLSHP